MSTPVLWIENLTKVYRTRNQEVVANDDINLTVNSGEIFGILGSNGAGKSTLIRQIMGTIPRTSGEIKINGKETKNQDRNLKNSLGYMTQGSLRALYHLKIEEAIYYTCRLKGQSRKQAKANAKLLLEELDLIEHRKKLLSQLSGGLLQMVNFAISVASAPEILILDEPTRGLDPGRRKKIWEYIHRINQHWGTTIILVTHNVLEAEMLLERLAILNSGKIITTGRPGELKQEVDNRLRIEIYLKPEYKCDEAMSSALETVGEFIQLDERHFVVLLMRDNFIDKLKEIHSIASFDIIDDFRIGMTSLEDVYIKKVGEKIV